MENKTMQVKNIANSSKEFAITDMDLQLINKYSTRPLTIDDVLCVEIKVCDNALDRDNEYFNFNSLVSISEQIIGKPVLLDHDWSSVKQVGRVYSSEVITEPVRNESNGLFYAYVRSKIYIPVGKKALVDDIICGVKKEVSVGVQASNYICHECGYNWLGKNCDHITAPLILDNITDVYEVSFVAVPAQPQAGVMNETKTLQVRKKLYNNIIRSHLI